MTQRDEIDEDLELDGDEEVIPAYPFQPQYYEGRPADDPERRYFEKRGARFDGETGRYIPGTFTPGK